MGIEAISISSFSVPLPKPRSVRRNLINAALSAPLERMCIEAMADLAMVIQAQPSARACGSVLAFYAAERICEFLPNEPVQFDPRLPDAPEAMFDLSFSSVIRPFHVSCSSSMIIPWRSRTSFGWLVIANSGRPDSVYVTHAAARHYSRRLRRLYIDSGLRNSHQLRLDIARATRAIAEFDLGIHGTDEQLTNVLAVGRDLLRTSSCYLSMPDDDADYFRFVGHLGVRTSGFKRLRMGAGQGLGGRVRDQNRPVRSLNYSQDFRECDAPVEVTVREGFHSAMCAPLMSDGRIFGLLYAANRHLTPFTEADEDVLEELAGNVSTMLRRAQWHHVKESAARRHERDRLARDLHDSVIHGLMEIGYMSRLGRDLHDPIDAKRHFDAIETAAEACLRAIRVQIAALTNDLNGCYRPSVENVVDLLKSTSGAERFAYSFRVDPRTARKELSPNVASALVRIGREALRNAELHSDGSRITVDLVVEKGAAHLRIEDNGRGIDANVLPMLLGSKEHLGLRQMRSVAEESGGRCILTSNPLGGFRVEAVVPLE